MLLSLLCLAFGIGAMNFVMPYIIMPSLSGVPSLASPAGVLYPNLALMCIAASLVIGVVIYFLSSLKVRKDTAYLGGETVDETSYPTGLDFYRTIETAPLIGTIYKWAKQKYLDVYDVSAKALRSCAFVLSEMHAGVLNSYVLWFVAGLIALLLISL
jgi:hypothetical protein